MGKISVTVRVPAVNSSFDFLVPDSMSVLDAQKLMVRILSSEYGIPDRSSDLMLMDRQDGKVLRRECSFRQMNVADGAHLILF